ncbi:MAG: helix-turn-helix domain-containing protein [Acidobacteriota bacterium]
MKDLLSPKELAEAIGVSQSSIKRWTDEGLIRATRTAGGHRRIPIAEAIRFVRETDANVIQPQALGLSGSTQADRTVDDLESAAADLERYLHEGAVEAARGLVLSLYLAGFEIADIADGPVRQTFTSLGHLYHHETDEGIFIEHRATQICLQAFHALRSVIAEPSDGPLAIGGAVAGDPYQLPTQLAATALASVGSRTMNLGPDTPISTLERAARMHDTRLIWLSVSAVAEPDQLKADIESMVAGLDGENIGIALGGREVAHIGLHHQPGLFIGRSMAELVAYARGLESMPRALPS